ncbi:4318_t:CDS:2 [Funneliformis geosporum]|nr:4318_t:CDS:2 [Funneliformis geosporum]
MVATSAFGMGFNSNDMCCYSCRSTDDLSEGSIGLSSVLLLVSNTQANANMQTWNYFIK